MLQQTDFSKLNKYSKSAITTIPATYLSDATKKAAKAALNLGIKGNTEFDQAISKTELIAKLEDMISGEADQTIKKYPWSKERPDRSADPGMWSTDVDYELMHIYSGVGYELCLKVTIHMMYHMPVGFIDAIKNKRKKTFLSNAFQKIGHCGLPVGDIVQLTEFMREQYNDEEGDTEFADHVHKEAEGFVKMLHFRKKPKSLKYLVNKHKEVKRLFTKEENAFLTEMLDIIQQTSNLQAPWRQYDESGVMEFIEENNGWDYTLREENLLVLTMGGVSELDIMYDEYTYGYGGDTGAPFMTFKIQTKEDLQKAAQYVALVRRCARLFSRGNGIKWKK